MTPENKDVYYWVLFIINDYLYFYDNEKLYRTDFDFDNIEIVKDNVIYKSFFTNGKYIYFKNYEKINAYDGNHYLMRMNLDGSDEKILHENVGTYVLTDENIYFTYFERNIEAMENGEFFDNIKGKIYKMGIDDENVKLIANFPNLFMWDFLPYKNYIYLYTVDWENRQDNYSPSMYPYPFRIKIGSDEPPQELVYNP